MSDAFAWIDQHTILTWLGLAAVLILCAAPTIHGLYIASRTHKDADKLARGPAPSSHPGQDSFTADHANRPRVGLHKGDEG